ncbi:MAG: GNAT family N-acetyltransferase [Bacteroidales bacterium]|nr:GNAT family N-acetyltransferase [Bacteroidales bacterium]
METQTDLAPTTQVAEKKAATTYTFREITGAEELEQAFRLRYEVYENSRLNQFLKHNPERVDMDEFDFHSRHYGIFNEKGEIIAYLRVVLDRSELINQSVFEVLTNLHIDLMKLNSIISIKEHSPDFPFLSYPEIPDAVKSHYLELKAKQEGFAEASRLIIKEELRGPRISGFLIESAMMLFMMICHEKKHAIVCCDKQHSFFYERYGFKPFGDGQTYEACGTKAVSVFLTLNDARQNNINDKFSGLAVEYSLTGKITRTL